MEYLDNENIIIRQPHLADIERIMVYFESLGETSRKFFHPHPFDLEHAKLICIAPDEQTYRLVIEKDGRIIGYAWFGPAIDNITQYPTVGIGISDDHQGRGLGAVLMNALIEEAKKRGHPGLSLTVYRNNDKALKLYTSCGYKVVGELGEQHVMDLVFE